MDPSILIDRRVEAPSWPEPVRIVWVEPIGNRFEVHAELSRSGLLRKQILSEDQIAKLRQNPDSDLGFDANTELAHTEAECVKADELIKAAKIYTALVRAPWPLNED